MRSLSRRLMTAPALVRTLVIGLCALAGIALNAGQAGAGQRLWSVAGTTLGLTLIAAISLPPTSVRNCAAPSRAALEAAAAAGLAIASGQPGLFLIYIAIPLATLGRSSGWRWAIGTWGGIATVTLALRTGSPPNPTAGPLADATGLTGVATTAVLAINALVALAASRSHRTQLRVAPDSEPSYVDAHRLLSELNLVARKLSLGLDPHTLASALVEELTSIARDASVTVLARSAGGRLVPVVGDPPNALTESVVMDSWVSADVVRRGRSGQTVVALPVQMGERVVAVAVLASGSATRSLSDEVVAACREVITQAGPRLASALLFDDVRRLATVDERHRLAREIHDGIAQDLASVGYLIDDIANDADQAVAVRLGALREHLTQLVSELRLSIFDLRMGVDPSVGLSRTMSDYLQRIGTQSGLIVHVSAEESANRLSLATEVELLRIVQEAVTNVRRHAQASNLWLTIKVDPPNAWVSVLDDGNGLGAPRQDSMGILGMQERAERIGASLTVRNRDDDRGTRVDIILEPRRTTTQSNSMITHTRSIEIVSDSPGEQAPSELQARGGRT